MSDLYHGEYPVDMTPAEARDELARRKTTTPPEAAGEHALVEKVAWRFTTKPIPTGIRIGRGPKKSSAVGTIGSASHAQPSPPPDRMGSARLWCGGCGMRLTTSPPHCGQSLRSPTQSNKGSIGSRAVDDLVERVLAELHRRVGRAHPIGANPVEAANLTRAARAIIPLVLRDAARICEQECEDCVEGAAMADLIRARASEIEEQRG